MADKTNPKQLQASLSELLFKDCRTAFPAFTETQLRRAVENTIRQARRRFPDVDSYLASMVVLAGLANNMRLADSTAFFELNSGKPISALRNYLKIIVNRLHSAAANIFAPVEKKRSAENLLQEAPLTDGVGRLLENFVLSPAAERWVN